jgi:hypothetical protein
VTALVLSETVEKQWVSSAVESELLFLKLKIKKNSEHMQLNLSEPSGNFTYHQV